MTELADRVMQMSATTGTGSLTLTDVPDGRQSFADAFSTGTYTRYVIEDANGSDWEVGYGRVIHPATLERTTVAASTNAGGRIVLSSAGSHRVFCATDAAYISALGHTDETNTWSKQQTFQAPLQLPIYTVATQPAGSEGEVAYFSDGDGGIPCLAVHDGVDWLVVELSVVISDGSTT